MRYKIVVNLTNSGTNLTNANFFRVKGNGIHFWNVALDNVSFESAELEDATFYGHI